MRPDRSGAMAPDALAGLPTPAAVALTARCHQRSAWRYRSEFGVEVWLPQDAEAADEEPDRRYAEGDLLPGGLLAVRTPGPEWPHYSFLLRARARRPVLFRSHREPGRRRADLRAAAVPRGSGRDASQRGAPAGSPLLDPLPGPRRADRGRSESRPARRSCSSPAEQPPPWWSGRGGPRLA